MKNLNSSKDSNATLITTTVIGVFFGLFSGVNHGIFEILQGNKPTGGLVINAIGEMQRFWPEGTEPAFTLIPNYLITGIVSIIVGILIIIWSLKFLPGKHGSTGFLALFILSFLVGGGMGQAFFFIPAWVFSTRIDKPLTWWRKVLPASIRPFLSKLWIITLITATLLMLIGLEMAIFGYFPGVTDLERLMDINMSFIFSSAILYIITYIAGFGRELNKQKTG